MNDDKVFVGLILMNVKDGQIGSQKNNYLDKKNREREVWMGKGMHWERDVALEVENSN